jgi:hypothetical protein
MPSLNLTPDLVQRFICLPGTALIHCSPVTLMTDSGKLFKPEAAADWERKNLAVRMGVVESICFQHRGDGLIGDDRERDCDLTASVSKGNAGWYDADSQSIRTRQTVYYLGRQDEADDEYVVVKIGQIVAALT